MLTLQACYGRARKNLKQKNNLKNSLNLQTYMVEVLATDKAIQPSVKKYTTWKSKGGTLNKELRLFFMFHTEILNPEKGPNHPLELTSLG